MGKVSLYLDEGSWQRFKRAVVQRTGDTRALSREVQRLIDETLVGETLDEGFKSIGFEFDRLPSSASVRAVVTGQRFNQGCIVHCLGIRELNWRRAVHFLIRLAFTRSMNH